MSSPYQRIDLSTGFPKKDNPVDNIPIEVILYSNYIRYDRLKELTLTQFTNSDANELNIYIDMHTMIKSIYNRNILGNSSIFASMILNLCSHMRAYYWTRHQVATNIYIVMTSNSTVLSQEACMVPEWNTTDKLTPNPTRDQVLLWNIQLLKLLVPYFPRLYFINGTVESAIMIQNLIQTNNNKYPNVILSKDLMTWQIPAMDSNSCVFRPRKSKDEDTSFCVNQFNVFNEWRHTINHSTVQPEVILPPEMLSLYIALTSFKTRGLSAYYSPKEATAILWNLAQERKIVLGYNSSDAILKVLRSVERKKEYMKDFESFNNNLYYRYNLVDLQRLTSIYNNMPEAHDRSWCYNKVDPVSIKEINDKYFINNPIDIIRLYENPGI